MKLSSRKQLHHDQSDYNAASNPDIYKTAIDDVDLSIPKHNFANAVVMKDNVRMRERLMKIQK